MDWSGAIPKRVIGTLLPLSAIEFEAKEFYRIAPPDVLNVYVNMGVQKFSAEDVERAFKPVEGMVAHLVSRGCDIIVQVGVPLAVLLGVEGHDRLMARIAKASGTPVSSSVTAVAGAAAHLGIRKIALANKWSDPMNAVLGEFFARKGVRIAGVCSKSMTPGQFLGMSTQAGMDLAYELGRRALRENPSADGLFLGGGSWLALPVVEFLEREFDLPCISNEDAALWDCLHRLGCWTPTTVSNRLLAGD